MKIQGRTIRTLGFTGTQTGMTYEQHREVRKLLLLIKPEQVIHGCCVGSDSEFCVTVKELLGIPQIGYPSTITRKVSKRACKRCTTLHPPMPPLVRNQIIVEKSDLLLATPEQEKMTIRSGTWSTIRKARKFLRPVFIIYPDGTVAEPVGYVLER
jgi:hypothetical protein